MSAPVSTRLFGDRALLVELADSGAAHQLAQAARERWGSQLADVVPGHRTVLLSWDEDGPPAAELAGWCQSRTADAPVSHPAGELLTIPVTYDGPDLEAVAATLGLDRAGVVNLHAGSEYLVAFIGFVPGFPYLIGGDPRFSLPRLAVPRPEVPAGSVAVAAGYCGIYPRASPGGWNLLGHSDLTLFDPDRDPPALLTPGTRVRFVPCPAPSAR